MWSIHMLKHIWVFFGGYWGLFWIKDSGNKIPPYSLVHEQVLIWYLTFKLCWADFLKLTGCIVFPARRGVTPSDEFVSGNAHISN